MRAHVSREKKCSARWRLLKSAMSYCRSSGRLEKRGGFLTFPDFSPAVSTVRLPQQHGSGSRRRRRAASVLLTPPHTHPGPALPVRSRAEVSPPTREKSAVFFCSVRRDAPLGSAPSPQAGRGYHQWMMCGADGDKASFFFTLSLSLSRPDSNHEAPAIGSARSGS